MEPRNKIEPKHEKTNWHMQPARIQISLGISLHLAFAGTAKDPNVLQVDIEDWLDWMDAQADLFWVQRSFCWFCHP